MFGPNHSQNNNVFVNGTHGQARYGMLSSKPFQNTSQHHHAHSHRHQHDSIGHSHEGFSHHQQNSSSSTFQGGNSAFTTNPARNNTPGHTQNGQSRVQQSDSMINQDLQYQKSQEMKEDHHHYARTFNQHKSPSSGSNDIIRKDADREQRQRSFTNAEESSDSAKWSFLDLSGQGLRAVSQKLFDFSFLTKLYLNHNRLTYVPASIGKLRALTHLDLSSNFIEELPAEIGMLVNLRDLRLFDNKLFDLPAELGYLYQLEFIGLMGNSLNGCNETIVDIFTKSGTKAMITDMRENAESPPPPNDRQLLDLDGALTNSNASDLDTFSIMSYNILCDRGATQSLYGYTPQRALVWESRRELILSELEAREADIICLQEIDTESYNEFFRSRLAHKDYKGVFWPRTRARTMTDKESKSVDGCATFFKNSKYVLLDKQCVDFANTAINRPDMRGEHDVFNRVMPRDHIAQVTFLEERHTGSRLIVVNAHIFWDQVYRDVKVVQVAILMEQLQKIAEQYSKHPPLAEKEKAKYRFGDADLPEGEVDDATAARQQREPGPSLSYSAGTQIPVVICADTNSMPNSGVHELLSTGSLSPKHADLEGYSYGNFTRDGMTHPFALKSAYGNVGELPFTNYTAGFRGVIDYIWYSTGSLSVSQLLGEVDEEYLNRVPGFPNWHFPSDHLALMANFVVKGKKGGKTFEADFGSQKDQKDGHRGMGHE